MRLAAKRARNHGKHQKRLACGKARAFRKESFFGSSPEGTRNCQQRVSE
jgi:hypothetical protein